jgi:DNA-binding response OmpR family regulator
MGDRGTRVLVVEDDAELREVYDRVLSTWYAVSTAATGADAVAAMTDDTDVVLLDRRLPDTDEAALVRDLKHRYDDCYVALVTAMEPDFGIIELGIDDYLVKPVTTAQLRDAVGRLCSLADYDATYRELSQKRVKRSVLAQEKATTTLQHSGEFDRLCADIERLERELDGMAETVGETERGLEP